MDHELKQRLIGAVVVTALCAIFIPMLFDDPVDNSGQSVSELKIPAPAPVTPATDTTDKLPANADQVLAAQEPEPISEEPVGDSIESTGALEEVTEEPDKQGQTDESLYAESDGYTQGEANNQEATELPDNAPVVSRPKPRPKPSVAEVKPLSANTLDSAHKVETSKNTTVEPVVQEPVKVKKVVETLKPAIPKKTELAPPTISKDSTAKAGALSEPTREQDVVKPIKQPNAAKSIAAAVAEAKAPTAVAKTVPPKLVRWYIQLGSFSKKENALSLWDSLREQGLPASLDTVQTDKGISYRLRVGPELDGKKAAAMKARLDKQGINAILMSE